MKMTDEERKKLMERLIRSAMYVGGCVPVNQQWVWSLVVEVGAVGYSK